jgi:integrase
MARPATGCIVEPTGTRKSWAIRFRANGKRQFVTLGRPEDGWNRERAEVELENVLADVRRGIWKPPEPEPVSPGDSPEETFHEFASQWYADREASWQPASRTDVKWALERHLLPVFGDMSLKAITVEDVDRFARAKQRSGKLGNNSINKCIQHLAAVLEQAVEWDRIPKNPAKGKKRRLPAEAPKRSRVEVEQFPALLRACRPHLRVLVAVLGGCGLRIGEAIGLIWADINLAAGTLKVKDSKTPAGVRTVDIPMGGAEELRSYKARRKPRPSDPVFLSVTGKSPQSVRCAESALKTAVKAANKELETLGIDPIDPGLTPHGLRRLYASLRFGAKDDPVYVAEQGGWTDPTFAMKVYAKAIRRRQRLTGTHAQEFDVAVEWALMGAEAPEAKPRTPAIPLPERADDASVV